jgi:hypothetical protein
MDRYGALIAVDNDTMADFTSLTHVVSVVKGGKAINQRPD